MKEDEINDIVNYYKVNGFDWQTNMDDLFIQSGNILYTKVKIKLGDVTLRKILDAGCGIGVFYNYIPSSIYYGIDISPDNINIAKNNLNFNGIFSEGDITHIDYPDDFFDGLISIEVIEHLTLDDLNLFLSEIKRVTKSGSKIVFSTPNLYYLWAIIPWSFYPFRQRLTLSKFIKGIKNGYINENYNIPVHHYRFKPKFLKKIISNYLKVNSINSTYWYNNRAIHKITPKLQMKILNFSNRFNPKCINIGMQLIIECINEK
jgi:SAM-dependent methyltransferase